MKAFHSLSCAWVAFLFSALVAGAQGKYKNVELWIDHADGRYQKNENVQVWATRLVDDGEKLFLTVRTNGQKEKKPLDLTVGEKTLILNQEYADPTAVILQVTPGSDNKIYSTIGFIVAAEEFRPGFDEPEDFMTFWQKQVKTMRKSKMKSKLTPVELTDGLKKYANAVEAYDLEISMPEGNPVRAYIAWPKDADARSCSILICPHGSGVRTSNLSNAVRRAKSLHAIVIDINAHGILNGQSDEYYKALNEGELKNYRTVDLTDREACYFRLMYLRMQRVLDYACSLKLWTKEKVALEGMSQGGAQSAALAGLDPRVKYVVLQVPAVTDLGGTLVGHSGSWPYYGKFKEERDGDYQHILPYYDAANFLRHYSGTLVVEAGLTDTTCGSECVFAAYNVSPSTDKTIATNPYRHHSAKGLWEENAKVWRETIDKPRKDALANYLKAD